MFDFSIERKRSELYMNIRKFFLERGYLEVFTPTLSDSLIPEPTIKNFETAFINEFLAQRKLYLIPSPEIFMKRMIANGSGSIFQISQCFRNAEQLGSLHNPEFSMLEYYSMDFDEEDSIALTIEMLRETAIKGSEKAIKEDPIIMSVRDAILEYSHFDLDKAQQIETIREIAKEKGHVLPEDESPNGRPVILKDYPKQIECLAAKKNDFYRARWEMYINGMEIANCYKEETDKRRAKEYYEKEYAKLKEERKISKEVIPDADFSFCDIDMRPSSGVAIGLDRLLMAETGKTDIEEVLPFSFRKMLNV